MNFFKNLIFASKKALKAFEILNFLLNSLVTYQISIKFHEKLKFEMNFFKKIFLHIKSLKSFWNFKILNFSLNKFVTYQITIKFHEKLKFEMTFFKKLILRQKALKAFEIIKF